MASLILAMVQLTIICGIPMPQTEFQVEHFEKIARIAEVASQAAEQDLLEQLQRDEFRYYLGQCCPGLVNLSAGELLAKLRAERQVAEIASGFPAAEKDYHDGAGDYTLDIADRTTWYQNQWEVGVEGGADFHNGSGWDGIQDALETDLYGLRRFKHAGAPASMAEAQERGSYFVLNTIHSAAGSALYGDVSFILNTSYAANASLYSAIDTGEWPEMCPSTPQGKRSWDSATPQGNPKARHTHKQNKTKLPIRANGGNGYWSNCSTYNFTLGTTLHQDHLILANLRYWAPAQYLPYVLARTLQLLLSPEVVSNGTSTKMAPLQGHDIYTYNEIIPAGRPAFPEGIKFVVGSFRSLFGTARGSQLQALCVRHGWMLAWAIGLNLHEVGFWDIGYYTNAFPRHGRMLDPVVLAAINATNVTGLPVQAFNRSWVLANLTRGHNASQPINGSTALGLWKHTAAGSSMRVTPLYAASCADHGNCVGVLGDGHCACYV